MDEPQRAHNSLHCVHHIPSVQDIISFRFKTELSVVPMTDMPPGLQIRRRRMHPRRRCVLVPNRHGRRSLEPPPQHNGRAEEEVPCVGHLEHVLAEEPFQGWAAVYECRVWAYG